MIPNNRYSTKPIVGRFINDFENIVRYSNCFLSMNDRDKVQSPYWDFTIAGKDIRDVSEGYLYQTWITYISIDFKTLFVYTTKTKKYPIVITGYNLSNCSLAFDENMYYYLTYMENGVLKFHYYETTTNSVEVLELDDGSEYPYVTIDDFRTTQSLRNDVLLFYVRDRQVYHRRQRDRFLKEIYLGEMPPDVKSLNRVNINNKYRLQFEFS